MANFKVLGVSAALATLWGCGGPEQATIDQFFRAAQSNDSTTIAYMAAVSPPVEVESWKVVEVTSRSTEPYTLPELVEQFKVAEKERATALDERQKFSKDNKDALEDIILKLRTDPEYKFKGKLGEIQEQWDKYLEIRKDKESKYQELKRVVDRQKSIAAKSVMRKVDVGTLHGAIAVTELMLNLKSKDGQELPFKAKLQRYDLSEEGSDTVEPARWIIVDIEGASPEAQAAAAAAAKAKVPTAEVASAETSKEPAPREPEPETAKPVKTEKPVEPSRTEPAYLPKELRGPAKVQILQPETKVVGDEVVSTIRARNASKDWITGFTVTEHWYDKEGNAVGVSSGTHQGRFMPGETIELQLKTRKSSNFFQNQYEFSHANGKVESSVVGSFPSQ